MASADRPLLRIKRVYEPPDPADGTRVLVERLWPRGLRKQDAAIALWAKEAAPSAELRRWFGHAPERWDEFRARYQAELRERPEAVAALVARLRREPRVTLVFAARDEAHNSAVVLREVLEQAFAAPE